MSSQRGKFGLENSSPASVQVSERLLREMAESLVEIAKQLEKYGYETSPWLLRVAALTITDETKTMRER